MPAEFLQVVIFHCFVAKHLIIQELKIALSIVLFFEEFYAAGSKQ